MNCRPPVSSVHEISQAGILEWVAISCSRGSSEYIMVSASLGESQAGLKIARKNINNLRYADDTSLMAGSLEELKGSSWEWKRKVKKLAWNSTFKTSDHGIQSHHFMGNRWGNSGNSVRHYFWGLQNHCRWWLQHEIKRRLLLGRKVMTNLDSILTLLCQQRSV